MWSRLVNRISHITALVLLAGGAVAAQQLPFRFESVSAGQATAVSLGGLVTFPPAPAGQSSVVTMRITSLASADWTLRDASVIGAGFSATVSPTPIPAGGQVEIPLVFTPTGGGAARAVLTLRLDGEGRTIAPTFSLSGTAGQDNIVIAYLPNASANPLTLSAGDTIRMTVANAGGRQTASVIISNRGVSAQPLQNVRVTGNSAFETGGLPVLPANLGPGGELRFFLTFSPTGRGPFEAQLSITIGGAARVFALAGELLSASFSFERITDAGVTPVGPDTAVDFGSASVGAPRTIVRIRVRNTGSLAGRINTVAVTGGAFQLIDAPPVPITLSPGDTVTLSIGFSPPAPGPATGRLTIDDTGVPLSGSGLGGQFNLTLTFAETSVALIENTTALLPNTPVGGRLPFFITVENAGNVTAPVTSLLVSGTGFSLVATPALPARLEPGASLRLEAAFAPTAVGAADGRFQLDQLVIPLRGVGNPPPATGALQFLNVRNQMEALQQPDLGIALADAYAHDLTGRLTLSFVAGNFQDDPAIQFLNGSRTIDFRIPAGATRAVFPNGSQTIRFQTGSSAGTIAISATLAVLGVNVTPAPAPVQEIVIAAAAPRIRALQLGARTGSRVDVVIFGASTARSVTRIRLRLNPTPRSNLQTTQLNINSDAAFRAWYQSAQSRPLGSQFAATVRLDITGDIRAIESVTVILENSLGDSAPVTVAVAGAEI